jgi:hypothetical protein
MLEVKVFSNRCQAISAYGCLAMLCKSALCGLEVCSEEERVVRQ